MKSLFLAATALALCLPLAAAATPPARAIRAQAAPAPLPAIDIPATRFVLKNGLTLIVHEDHKAPIVAVNVWYHVGSKNEPAGRAGFAHLFEHLMFGGKGDNQTGWFEKMEAIGATDINGTTNYDRTNFFETIPSAALDMTLFLESQRMGHLLDSLTDTILTTQRNVVENEKRQGDNQPYHVAEDIVARSVWPAGHPYSHTVIGEMNDLDAANVADVKDWFAKYYGPSNATIVLAGDITPAEAKTKVEHYFGDIPPGPPVARQKQWIAKRSGEQRAVAQDHVPQARFYKIWNVPGAGTADADYLDLLSDILSSGKDSRLYKRLIYQDQIATALGTGAETREIGAIFDVIANARTEADLPAIEQAVNEEIARLLRDGPTPEEVERVKTAHVADFARQIERVGGFGGKSDLLAESQTFLGSPDAWRQREARIRAATPRDLLDAGRRWLSDGGFVLDITPYPTLAAEATGLDRTSVPAPGAMKPPVFPTLRRATLSNGLKVIVIERHDTPTVWLDMVMDAGKASDQFARPGTAVLTASLLSDGTQSLNALELGDRLQSLGAILQTAVALDSTSVLLNGLSTRLDPSLDLFADILLHPAFRAADVEREKELRIAAIKQAKQNPFFEAFRLGQRIVYGGAHAYGVLPTEASVAALGRDDLVRYHQTWFHPNGATLVVVGDTDLATILPKLEARFGGWKPAELPKKNIGDVAAPAQSTIYLVDKPGASQSVILATFPSPPRVNPDDLALQAMNTVFGGAFTSRLNMNLREDKHWSYGAASFLNDARGPGFFSPRAAVQTDKTRESFLEMRRELDDIVKTRPVTDAEMKLARNALTLSLPGRWETSEAVASTVGDMVDFGLPDDYYRDYVQRIGALTPADASRAAQIVIKPTASWIVVGDRSKIEAGLRATGIPVQVVDADGNPIS
jgi:predicted Zn-dependent peptidase